MKRNLIGPFGLLCMSLVVMSGCSTTKPVASAGRSNVPEETLPEATENLTVVEGTIEMKAVPVKLPTGVTLLVMGTHALLTEKESFVKELENLGKDTLAWIKAFEYRPLNLFTGAMYDSLSNSTITFEGATMKLRDKFTRSAWLDMNKFKYYWISNLELLSRTEYARRRPLAVEPKKRLGDVPVRDEELPVVNPVVQNPEVSKSGVSRK